MKVLRWLLVPVAAVAAWYVALVLGVLLLGFIQSFCPEAQMISRMCTAPWWSRAELAVFCVGSALSAVLVVVSVFFVAPAAREIIAWLAFALGAIVALWFAAVLHEWPEGVSALAAGLATAGIFQMRKARRERARSA